MSHALKKLTIMTAALGVAAVLSAVMILTLPANLGAHTDTSGKLIRSMLRIRNTWTWCSCAARKPSGTASRTYSLTGALRPTQGTNANHAGWPCWNTKAQPCRPPAALATTTNSIA